MAEPARRPAAVEKAPVDPSAIDRAYRFHRARRRARLERKWEMRRAGHRFWIGLAVLLLVSVLILLAIWSEIERLFGL